jgi:hypothetical protein
MATNWDDRAHIILLQAIVQKCSLTAQQWEFAIEYTRTFGYNYTASAAQ